MEPIKISMTSFIDFVVASPGAKVGEVRDVQRLYGRGYQPAQDPYKEVREAILAMHKDGRPASFLRGVLPSATERMAPHWEACVDGYSRFVGRKKFVALPQSRPIRLAIGSLSVSVNPELALSINGEPHLIKLYFKSEKIGKVRVNSVLHLLQTTFASRGTAGILDVRRGKLFSRRCRRWSTRCCAARPRPSLRFGDRWKARRTYPPPRRGRLTPERR